MKTITELKQTCESCPSQWEGATSEGEKVYIRYRWGQLQAGTGEDLRTAVGNSNGDPDFKAVLGDEYDGEMSDEEMKKELSCVYIFQVN